MSLRESLNDQIGCGRKIRTGKNFRELIKQTLESLVDGKGASPSPGKDILDLEVPAAMRKNAEFLLSTDAFDIDYPCCTIIHDPCGRHIGRFPARSFDLVVTDPPYGKNIKMGQEHHAEIGWDGEYPFGIVDIIVDLCDLPRLGSYFFCAWDNLWDHEKRCTEAVTLRKPKSMLVWQKLARGGAGDCAHEHVRDYEMVYFFDGPEHKFKKRPKSVLKFKGSGNDNHPTEKPVELITQILSWYDFETVLDPFMGSGTTAVAALELKKHFLGFETDETYYRRAIQRIAETKRLLSIGQ